MIIFIIQNINKQIQTIMRKIVALLTIVALASCGSSTSTCEKGTSCDSTSCDSTLVVSDSTKVVVDSVEVK